MTSANTPSPYVISGTVYLSYGPWRAFTGWDPTVSGGGWFSTKISVGTVDPQITLPSLSSIDDKYVFIKAE
jgi:hypothetical protein